MSIKLNPKYRLAEALKERQALNQEIQKLQQMAVDNDMVSEMHDYLDSQNLLSEIGVQPPLEDTPEARERARQWLGI